VVTLFVVCAGAVVSVALRMSDVSGGCVNIDIGTMNAISCKVDFSCKIAAR